MMQNIPIRIFLHSDTENVTNDFNDFDDEDVLWSHFKIDNNDIEYVLLSEVQKVIDKLNERCKELTNDLKKATLLAG